MSNENLFAHYTITLTGTAKKVLKNVDKQTCRRLLEKIEMLVVSPHLLDIKKLTGYKALFRIRVGDYRVVYLPDHDKKEILVCIIGHRGQVYQLLKNMPHSMS